MMKRHRLAWARDKLLPNPALEKTGRRKKMVTDKTEALLEMV